jgi:hypothetical protein
MIYLKSCDVDKMAAPSKECLLSETSSNKLPNMLSNCCRVYTDYQHRPGQHVAENVAGIGGGCRFTLICTIWIGFEI